MRKLLAVTTIALALNSLSVHAVDAGQTQFSIGGGLNLNFVDTSGDFGDWEEETSLDLAIAGKVEYGFNDLWSLRTGLWLQEKTAKISYDQDGIDGEFSVNTIYASVPVNAQLKINKQFSIFGGYNADFRINDYCSVGGDFDDCSLTKDTESVVHSAVLGASIWANDNLQVDVAYTHGLTDTMDTEDAGYKINTLSAALFVKF